MSIYKTLDLQDGNFFQAPNGIAEILRNHPRALLVYNYLIEKPEDWKINRQDIMKRLNIGVYALRSAFKVLQEKGFLVVKKLRNKVGKFIYEYCLFQKPIDVENDENSKKPRDLSRVQSSTHGSLMPIQRNNKQIYLREKTKNEQSVDKYNERVQELLSWFDKEVWERYEVKKNKEKAIQAIILLNPSREVRGKIISSLQALNYEREVLKKSRKFVGALPHLHRWIRNERWLDYTHYQADTHTTSYKECNNYEQRRKGSQHIKNLLKMLSK